VGDKSLFPGVVQFGFDPDTGSSPNLHLVFTIWIECVARRIAIPVNSAAHDRGVRLGYMVFEGTGVMQAGLEAFRLVGLHLEQPSDLSLSTYQQVFAWSDHLQSAEGFLVGIVPHG
jgi:hypothetical protein